MESGLKGLNIGFLGKNGNRKEIPVISYHLCSIELIIEQIH